VRLLNLWRMELFKYIVVLAGGLIDSNYGGSLAPQAWRTSGAEVPNCHTVQFTATPVDHNMKVCQGVAGSQRPTYHQCTIRVGDVFSLTVS
jgi:hypothetical protein